MSEVKHLKSKDHAFCTQNLAVGEWDTYGKFKGHTYLSRSDGNPIYLDEENALEVAKAICQFYGKQIVSIPPDCEPVLTVMDAK